MEDLKKFVKKIHFNKIKLPIRYFSSPFFLQRMTSAPPKITLEISNLFQGSSFKSS